MQSESKTRLESTSVPTDTTDTRYKLLLEKWNINSQYDKYHFVLGESKETQGWILHLSIIRHQLLPLLEIIIPLFIKEKVCFKIPKDYKICKNILDGNFGYTQIGKIITIFTNNETDAKNLANKINLLTKSFQGPVIPTDIKLGEILFTRYGSYKANVNSIKEERFIITGNEELIVDEYNIPFIVPRGINWPFFEITTPTTPILKKLLNNTYKPIALIKPDAKGRVMKGIYFKYPFIPKLCLIKEGKNNMWSDDIGRSIKDRLLWQSSVTKFLQKDILVPKIIDFFSENDDTYLVMEYIQGNNLETVISHIYQDCCWVNLLVKQKVTLIDYLLNIINIVKKIHSNGLVHRDINPGNFIIDKNDRVFILDMELAYSIINKSPTPPFELGTIGFMAVEQLEKNEPTIYEDIYALGALMIVFLTNLSPIKLNTNSSKLLFETLSFITKSELVSDLISQTLSFEPNKRPKLSLIETKLLEYKHELNSSHHNIESHFDPVTEDTLNELVNLAIKGLSNPLMMNAEHLWLSKSNQQDDIITTNKAETNVYTSIYNGISGILYVLSKAKAAGYNIECCINNYKTNIEYVINEIFCNPIPTKPGLYDGTAGIALMISQSISANLFEMNTITLGHLKNCFTAETSSQDIATGTAGQGLSLNYCMRYLPSEFSRTQSTIYVRKLIESQNSDGSWNLFLNKKKYKNIITGLSGGVSGIIYYLITQLENSSDPNIEKAIEKGLSWLVKQAYQKKNQYSWGTSSNSKITSIWNLGYGLPGIALCFIKAYKLLNIPLYRKVATGALSYLNQTPVISDFSQESGLSGLGEVYIEAFNCFKDEEWHYRFKWIETFLAKCVIKNKNDSSYWSFADNYIYTPGLLQGNSGIIHFLMRCSASNKINFMLLDS